MTRAAAALSPAGSLEQDLVDLGMAPGYAALVAAEAESRALEGLVRLVEKVEDLEVLRGRLRELMRPLAQEAVAAIREGRAA